MLNVWRQIETVLVITQARHAHYNLTVTQNSFSVFCLICVYTCMIFTTSLIQRISMVYHVAIYISAHLVSLMMSCSWVGQNMDWTRWWNSHMISPGNGDSRSQLQRASVWCLASLNAKTVRTPKKRLFPFGTDTLEEVTHCTHLGVTLCSYDSSSKRTEEACDKGRRQLATLHSSGVRSNGSYPFVCSFLWNRICLPSMLHGCELWNNMNQYELNDLEQTQSRTFRLIQNIPPRTHSVLTRGLLGQLAINCHVKLQKLMFLQRLVAASPKLLVKQMFLRRLYECMQYPRMKGFIPDIHHILNSVDLTDTLLIYMQGGRFPSKREWRGICRNYIRTLNYNINVNNLRDADARYARQMTLETHPQRHPFYDVIKRSRDIRHNVSLLWLIRTLTLPGYGYDTRTCTLCGKIYEDIMIHVIAECPTLFQERNTLWDFIVDDLNVNLSVRLSCLRRNWTVSISILQWYCTRTSTNHLLIIIHGFTDLHILYLTVDILLFNCIYVM